MLIGLVILALVVVGLFVAFAAVLMFWIAMIVFWMSTVILALLVGDPYLGFFLAFPVTGLIMWGIGRISDKPSAPESP